MRKSLLLLIIFLITIFICNASTAAETIFEDTFNDMTKIDTAKTTAFVDTAAGEITLPRNKLPSSIVMSGTQNEFAAINGGEVAFYNFDPVSNAMKKNDLLSITNVTSPIGIAAGQNSYSMWVLTNNEIKRYDFNGSGMSNNPYLSVTGLTDVFAISSSSLDDTVVTLSKDSTGKGVINTYKSISDGASQAMKIVPQLAINTGIDNPLSVSFVSNTCDIALAAGDSVYYYSLDSDKGKYTQNVLMNTVSGNIMTGMSAQNNGEGYVTVGPTSADHYVFDVNTSKVSRIPILSTSLNTKYNYSIALKPDSYEYAILTDDGTIQYWMYDETSGKMVENKQLEVDGIAINKRYQSPGEYVSQTFTSSRKFNEVRITGTEDKPGSSTITWSVSCDGGTTWKEFSEDSWTDIPESSSFVIKAVLEAQDNAKQDPPKVSDVKLEGTMAEISGVRCLAITKNHDGQTLPSSTFPVKAKKGSQVVFAVDTFGFTHDVSVVFSTGETLILKSEKPDTEEKNSWIGSITFEPDEKEGEIIGMTVKGSKGTRNFEQAINNFIVINESVIYNTDIRLTK